MKNEKSKNLPKIKKGGSVVDLDEEEMQYDRKNPIKYYFWILERDSFHKNPEKIYTEIYNFEHKSNHWKPVLEFLKLYISFETTQKIDKKNENEKGQDNFESHLITHFEAEKNLQKCGLSRTKLAQKTFALLKERDTFYPKMGKLVAKTKESLLKRSRVPQSGN